ncbi:hypothetical protein ACO0LF_23265 [Undibacterium sp. Di27W]|uniref:hypothetical protein n=1 Tax=Undibacterium sp. Di27W TaxID=3413036 RepID=UPI003BF314F0
MRIFDTCIFSLALAGVTGLTGLLCTDSATAADLQITDTYKNPAYGFSIHFPHPIIICTTPPPAPNHGFVALLRTDTCADGALEQSAHLELFVRYDVLTMAQSTAELANELCENQAARRSVIRIAGLPVYQCPSVLIGELTMWRYFFLRPKKNATSQIYSLDLYSNQAYEKQDQWFQKQMLKRLKFTQNSATRH